MSREYVFPRRVSRLAISPQRSKNDSEIIIQTHASSFMESAQRPQNLGRRVQGSKSKSGEEARILASEILYQQT